MKNITFSAEDAIIRQARLRAMAEQTTLNEKFREWLRQYALSGTATDQLDEVLKQLSYVDPGRSFTREERNER